MGRSSQIKVLLAGDKKLSEFYKLFFEKNGITVEIYEHDGTSTGAAKDFDAILVFGKHDVHSAEDEIKDIKASFSNKIPIMPVIENEKFFVIESLYNLSTMEICFDFKPENILEELNKLVERNLERLENNPAKGDYLINFYENKGSFIVDISGPLIKDKIVPLKLMFSNYLKGKTKELRAVIYVFSDIDEKSITFENIWSLLRIWKDIGIDYKNVTFLTTSENIKQKILKYFGQFGIEHFDNLLEIVKDKYPELAKRDEMALFEFSSQLLQTKK